MNPMIQNDLRGLAFAIDDLNLLPGNPRRGNVDAVARSLEAFGQRKPVVARRSDRVVIAGNHTLQAARALGWSEIAVVWVDDDEVTSKAFALADNRTAELGDYDQELLAELISKVGSVDAELLVASGWSEEAVAELVAALEPEVLPVAGDPDEVPESVVGKSVLGDVWLLGPHRVMCGDSTSLTDIEKLLSDNEVGLVLTDPPYGVSVVKSGMVGADFGVAKKGNYKPIIGDNSVEAALASFEIVKNLSERLIFWGGNYYADKLEPSSCWLVWDKRGDSGIVNTFADAELAWTNMTSPVRVFRQLWNGMIREGEHEKRVHPTQKPVALLKWCIDSYAQNGIVLDLFGGSGSTLIAAHQSNRVAYLMELDPHYVDVICARFQKATGIKPVAEATGREHDFLDA
jgi:DNA modification methylase